MIITVNINMSFSAPRLQGRHMLGKLILKQLYHYTHMHEHNFLDVPPGQGRHMLAILVLEKLPSAHIVHILQVRTHQSL